MAMTRSATRAYDTPTTRYGHPYDKAAQDLEEAAANIAYYTRMLEEAAEAFREAVGAMIEQDGDADRAVDISWQASGGMDLGDLL